MQLICEDCAPIASPRRDKSTLVLHEKAVELANAETDDPVNLLPLSGYRHVDGEGM
jgi:hypothetical protein